jgi:hypothetical protein
MATNFVYRRTLSSVAIIKLLYLLVLLFDGNRAFAAQAQDPNAPQANTPGTNSIEAVPNRPTFSTTAETVQRGVFEIEYGIELAQGHQDINGLLKFGLTKNIELRFANNPIVRDAGTAGFGDSGAGFKYRFLEEKRGLPTLSVLYGLTIPTAKAELSSSGTGHSAGILISKDIGKHHLDFNECVQWLRRSDSDGFDRNYFTAFAYSHPISGKLGFSEEVAGYSHLNATTGATLTVLQALTYSVSPRLVLDGGFYIGAMGDLPRATFFSGVTYSVVDLYRLLRHTAR